MVKITPIFLLIISMSLSAPAQVIDYLKGIKARSLSIEVGSSTGDFKKTSFSAFRNNARFGSIFEPENQTLLWQGNFQEKELNLLLNYEFKDSSLYRHELISGIRKVNQNAKWYGSTDGSRSYRSRSEMMKFILGYRYYFVHRKILRIATGAQTDFGFTISAFTKESADFNTYEYFAHKSLEWGIDVPIAIELRLFSGAWIYLTRSFGVGYFALDDTGQVIFNQSLLMGFRFHL